MKRYLAQFGIAASLMFCNGALADSPPADTVHAPGVERLDAILRRLEAIEKRLARVEADTKLFSDWTVDERGVMRLRNGRAVGFWGIDGPMAKPIR